MIIIFITFNVTISFNNAMDSDGGLVPHIHIKLISSTLGRAVNSESAAISNCEFKPLLPSAHLKCS